MKDTDKALEAVHQARLVYDFEYADTWSKERVEPLLKAAELLGAKAKEAEEVREMLGEELRARGVKRIPGRPMQAAALLLLLAETVILMFASKDEDAVKRMWALAVRAYSVGE